MFEHVCACYYFLIVKRRTSWHAHRTLFRTVARENVLIAIFKLSHKPYSTRRDDVLLVICLSRTPEIISQRSYVRTCWLLFLNYHTNHIQQNVMTRYQSSTYHAHWTLFCNARTWERAVAIFKLLYKPYTTERDEVLLVICLSRDSVCKRRENRLNLYLTDL